MKIHIILTNYLLQFMYGDQAFKDPLLLSREILKKAYKEGLYYISNKKMIDKILETGNFPRNIFLFAGIPTVEEIALTHTIKDDLTSLKISLPYEKLVDFSYSKDFEDTSLIATNINQEDLVYEKVILQLSLDDNKPIYTLSNEEKNRNEINSTDLSLYFSRRIEQYVFAIKKNLDFLQERLNNFFHSEVSKLVLEDNTRLQFVKVCYEDIFYHDNDVKKL